MSWWVHSVYDSQGPVILFSWIVWVIGSIVLHELAHGWAALWQGDTTPRDLGHMTPNPLVHMPGFALIVFALAGITWGLMPVNPSRFRWGAKGHAFVAAAGPAMNIVLAIIAIFAAAALIRFGSPESQTTANLVDFFFVGSWLNLLLAAFNLLPVPPLDGSAILGGFSREARALFAKPQAAMVGLLVMVGLIVSGLIGVAFNACQQISIFLIQLLVQL